MSLTGRVRRASVAALIALVLVAGGAFAATAKHGAAAAAVPALPDPLTKEAVRELVARLSDDEVRKLLLDQLDRAAAPALATSRAGKGMSGMVDQNAEMVRTRLGELRDALGALPQTLRDVIAKLDNPEGPSALPLVGALLVGALVVAWLAQRMYDFALRHYRRRLVAPPVETFTASAFRLAVGLALDLVGIAVFALAFLAIFLALWQGHGLRRIAILELLIAVVAVRITWLFAEFLLSSRGGEERLLPFADAPARRLRWFAVLFAALWGLGSFCRAVLMGAGANAATIDLLLMSTSVLGLAIVLWTVWGVRAAIAGLIRGEGKHNAVIGWVADLWPVLAIMYFVAIVAARAYDILMGTPVTQGAGAMSVLLVVALPIVDMALCRALAAAAGTPAAGTAAPGFVAAYESVFRRAIHIVVVVVGLLLLAYLWEVNLFAMAQASMGGKISSSLFGVCIVLLLAYITWEVAKTAIDRQLAAEGELDLEHPASRLRTLLPILRILILVTIVVMTSMSVLAALGVDILPLLAGASVIGVAIGFGSQTLVRDVVSGAFFLMDDAFRLGEYIEIGSDKGRVEKINIRSLFLRHHRGALNVLPYGEIKRLRNTSRDWSVYVLDFRLTYDTNLMQVKKILKQVGDELAADPELAPDLLQPLKFGGVTATEDSAIVVRAKFTARPEGEPWMIQKAAYAKILKAFRDAGIKFAHRQVTVYVPPSAGGDESAKAAAGAAAAAAQSPQPPG